MSLSVSLSSVVNCWNAWGMLVTGGVTAGSTLAHSETNQSIIDNQ
jgi:hypothetical protein